MTVCRRDKKQQKHDNNMKNCVRKKYTCCFHYLIDHQHLRNVTTWFHRFQLRLLGVHRFVRWKATVRRPVWHWYLALVGDYKSQPTAAILVSHWPEYLLLGLQIQGGLFEHFSVLKCNINAPKETYSEIECQSFYCIIIKRRLSYCCYRNFFIILLLSLFSAYRLCCLCTPIANSPSWRFGCGFGLKLSLPLITPEFVRLN